MLSLSAMTMPEQRPLIVLSAVSLRKGGTLTILRQALHFLSGWAPEAGYRVLALVHKRELADYPNIEYMEFPEVIQSWSKRLRFEYWELGRLSRQLGPVELWLSMHDTTPRVQAHRQAVYCQTSFPFMRWRWRDFLYDRKIPLFAMFTRLVYQFGIQRNSYLIVQQQWLRRGFSQMFGLPESRFIVAPPERADLPRVERPASEAMQPYTFLYASTPDVHKNFEAVCEATRLLEARVGKGRFRTLLTMTGRENAYAEMLRERWGGVSSLVFDGFKTLPELQRTYAATDCLLFTSRVETWGLPISEFMSYERPMILSDLPFAHETAAGAGAVAFCDPMHPEQLSERMEEVLRGDLTHFISVDKEEANPPYAADWLQLFKLLLDLR